MPMEKEKALRQSNLRTSVRDRETSSQLEEALQSSPSREERQSLKSDFAVRLRNIIWATRLFPFIYTALLVVLYAAYSFSSGVILDLIDYFAYVSPIVVLAHLAYSRILKMCRWHRIACALPLIPQSVDLFDAYVYHLEHYAWIVTAATIMITLILFLIAIYKVFMTDDGRIC